MSTAKPRGESWGSDSFSVVSLSDCRDSGDESDVRISVSADEAESGEWEDVGVHINAPDEVAGVQDPVTVVVMKPHEIVNDYCENPRPREGDNSRGRVRSRSRDAKEALMAFYLGRAKLSETRSKAFVVTPAPPVEIPPLKAPGAFRNAAMLESRPLSDADEAERYSVAVREEVLRIENERRAKSALEQFYRRREDTKLKRAVLNRMNEFKLYQTQCGLTTTGSIIHQQH